MTDIKQLIECLRAAAEHRAGTDNRLSLPEEFIEAQAADALEAQAAEIEDLRTSLEAARLGSRLLGRQVDKFKRAWRRK
jgi:hypothetical protein